MDKSKWGFDLDPTAGFELCSCGSGLVPIGAVCVDCERKALLAELRKFYPPDEAEVRGMLMSHYAEDRAQVRYRREVALPATTLEPRLLTRSAHPRYFAGKVLQVWEVKATTGADIETWFVVGPDPWEAYSAQVMGSVEHALGYYRATQFYDAEGWRLDPTTGKRGDEP